MLNIASSIAFEVVLFLRVDQRAFGRPPGAFPALFSFLGTVAACLYVWFLVIGSLTYVLIRDKRKLMQSVFFFEFLKLIVIYFALI